MGRERIKEGGQTDGRRIRSGKNGGEGGEPGLCELPIKLEFDLILKKIKCKISPRKIKEVMNMQLRKSVDLRTVTQPAL